MRMNRHEAPEGHIAKRWNQTDGCSLCAYMSMAGCTRRGVGRVKCFESTRKDKTEVYFVLKPMKALKPLAPKHPLPRAIYQCRLCGENITLDLPSSTPVHQLMTEIANTGIEGSSRGTGLVRDRITHNCCNGGIGLADLLGCKNKE